MICDVRFTSSAAYEVHNICVNAGLPYARLTPQARTRYTHALGSHVPNTLLYVEDVSTLLKNWEALASSQTRWAIVVHAGEDEATEFDVAYTPRATSFWIISSLIAENAVEELKRVSKEPKMNVTYLTPILTELYKIQPKEARPFATVFKYLAGVTQKIDHSQLSPGLSRAVTNAEPLRKTIKTIKDRSDIIEIRAVAKNARLDVFEINYTLAKAAQ